MSENVALIFGETAFINFGDYEEKEAAFYGCLLAGYRDPFKPGSLGGLTRFAKANNISVKRAREVLDRDLGYTLHKPRRRQFPTLPVLVFGIDA